jgi:hypothetical protein
MWYPTFGSWKNKEHWWKNWLNLDIRYVRWLLSNYKIISKQVLFKDFRYTHLWRLSSNHW